MSAELTKEPAQWDGWTEDARSKPAAKFWPRMGTWGLWGQGDGPTQDTAAPEHIVGGRERGNAANGASGQERFLRSRSLDVLSEASVVPRNAAAVLGVKSGVGGHRFHAVFKPRETWEQSNV